MHPVDIRTTFTPFTPTELNPKYQHERKALPPVGPHSCSLLALEIFRALPLVCRTWHQPSLSPQLLRALRITLPQGSLPRLRSLCEWLVLRAAGHVRRLEIDLFCTDIPLEQQEECHELVSAMLAGCGAAGSLEYLFLAQAFTSGLHLPSAAVVALRTLRR